MNSFKELRMSRLESMYEKYGDLAATIVDYLITPDSYLLLDGDAVASYSTFHFKPNPKELTEILFFLQELKALTDIPITFAVKDSTIYLEIKETSQ